jgi:hypothetical protein
MVQDEQLEIFELGKVVFDNNEEIWLEEITVNVTRDLSEYYTTDSFDAKEIRPGRKKIDFTIRKAKDLSKSGLTLTRWFASTKSFQMSLYALNVKDDLCNAVQVAELQGCRLSKSQIGNFDASKPVQEDLEGKAKHITWFGYHGERFSTPVCPVG